MMVKDKFKICQSTDGQKLMVKNHMDVKLQDGQKNNSTCCDSNLMVNKK